MIKKQTSILMSAFLMGAVYIDCYWLNGLSTELTLTKLGLEVTGIGLSKNWMAWQPVSSVMIKSTQEKLNDFIVILSIPFVVLK